MFITGISDEAGKPLPRQIQAHAELGWRKMEIRALSINGGPVANLHDISEAEFDLAEGLLRDAGMEVYCFSSKIGNWQKQINESGQSSLDETKRAVARMKRLGTQYIRIMSFALLPDTEDQMAAERFHRVREIVKLITDEGLTPLHENCMNYGGMGWPFTLELLAQVPGLKLVFDTGNPVFADDRSQPRPRPKQSAWEFYQHVRDHIEYVHIKDAVWDAEKQKPAYCFPGEGDGDVVRIMDDLRATGYDGGFSIEPHIEVVHHEVGSEKPEDQLYATYVAYGRRLEELAHDLVARQAEPAA